MIPEAQILSNEIEEISYPTLTYKILKNKNRIDGYVDGLEAIAQAVYLILNTERYKYIIYSWDYGVELEDLFGKPIPYVMSEIERRVKEALMQDDRIEDVTDFEFSIDKNVVTTKFKVTSVEGVAEIEKVVSI